MYKKILLPFELQQETKILISRKNRYLILLILKLHMLI